MSTASVVNSVTESESPLFPPFSPSPPSANGREGRGGRASIDCALVGVLRGVLCASVLLGACRALSVTAVTGPRAGRAVGG
jgi:hypothetical protein